MAHPSKRGGTMTARNPTVAAPETASLPLSRPSAASDGALDSATTRLAAAESRPFEDWLLERLILLLEPMPFGCWLWRGEHSWKGYGRYRASDKAPFMAVHRAM